MSLTNTIHFRNLRGDLFGGLTAAIVSLPLALAFGVASGAGPVAGLYGAVCVGFFAALFGGTPTLISEPRWSLYCQHSHERASFRIALSGGEDDYRC